jgi:hypothetical protein
LINDHDHDHHDHTSGDISLTEINDEDVEKKSTDSSSDHEHIRKKKEITELCALFLGNSGQQLYVIVICLYAYGALWCYSSVFAKSFATALFNDEGESEIKSSSFFDKYSYQLFLILFSCVVIPVSLLEFSEQVYLQVSLAIFRVVMVLVMILSIVLAYNSNENQFQLAPGYQEDHDISVFFHYDLSKIYLLTPIAAYAFIFHHSVPALAEPIADKTTLNHLFKTALIVSMIFYIALGVIISAYFGHETEQSSNLMWKNYIGYSLSPNNVSWFASLSRFFVLLFPAVDVASAFPLNAFTLGNNLMTAYYGKEIHKYDNSRFHLTIFRLIAAVPPICGALIIKDLGKITSYAGLTGFVLAFVFPPVLAYASEKKLNSLGIDSETIHSNFWTSRFFQFILCLSGIFLVFYVGYILMTTK